MRRALVVLALAPLSCMGALEARLRVETARSSHLATQCAALTQGAATEDAGVFGGGLLDFRAELGTQLEGLVGGVGGLQDQLARFGGGADLDPGTRIVRELATLDDDLDPQLITQVAAVTGAISVLTTDFAGAKAAAASLSDCVGQVSVTSSLDHDAQQTAASLTVQSVLSCHDAVGTLSGILGGLDDHLRAFENRYTAIRGVVEAMQERGETEPAAKLRGPLEEITALLRAQAQWLDESRAIVGALAAFDLGDPVASASKLGQRLLARQAGGVAQAMFRVVRIGLRPIDKQLAELSESGYGVGALSVVFASGYIDRAVARVGVSTGKLARKLGGGANAMLYEACTALVDPRTDDGLTVLGMTSFYAGFIDGYGPAQALAEETHASASWWRDAVFASTGEDAHPTTDAPVLTAVQNDLLADWTALFAIHRAHAWGPPPAPQDRRAARLAYVETLLASPELLGGSSTTFLDTRLVNVFLGGSSSSPSGGGGGGGPASTDHTTRVSINADSLTEPLGELAISQKTLIDQLTIREGHWKASQFAAAVCQSIQSDKVAKSSGVTCPTRDANDAVSTLTMSVDEFDAARWALDDVSRKAAKQLARSIRAQASTVLGDLSKLSIVVTGYASQDELACDVLARALADDPAAPPTCDAGAGTAGVDLCHDGSTLRSGDQTLTCGTDFTGNELLEVLRGWSLRAAMVDGIKARYRADFAPRVTFQLDPPEPQGLCDKKNRKKKVCTEFRVAQVQVRAQ